MFFRKDYDKPGPGVEPDEPEKTGFARFFQIVQLECMTLLKLNLLVLACCLPVVTIPPALFAMVHVIRMMVLDQPVDLWYRYKTAFRQCFAKSYLAFGLSAGPMALAGWGMGFYLRYAASNPIAFAPFMVCSTVFLAALLACHYLYALLDAGLPAGRAVRLALILSLGKPLRAVAAAAGSFGLTAAALMPFPLSAPYFIFLGLVLPCLLAQFFIRTVLRDHVAGIWPSRHSASQNYR